MSCGVGCRLGSDPILLWPRPAAAAPIQPLAWEPPYAKDMSLKKKKERERERNSKREGINNGNNALLTMFFHSLLPIA